MTYPRKTRTRHEMIPLSPLQELGGRVMREALDHAAPATIHRTAEAEALLEARRRADYEDAERNTVEHEDLPADPLVLRAAALALKAHPWMNGRLVQGEVSRHHEVTIGVTVGREDGILAPVVRRVSAKTPYQLAGHLTMIARDAAAGRYDIQEMRHASFLMVDLSRYGAEHFTPLLLPGLIAAIGVGAVRYGCRPGEDGGCKAAPELPLSLTFDHRAVDAVRAARFLAEVAERLTRPDEL